MMASKCQKFCPLNDFLLQHDRPSDFVHSVLFASPIPYAVAMTCVSIHTLTMAIYSGFSSVYKEKILIWLTYWSFFTLTARFLLTAINAWTYVFLERKKRLTAPMKSRCNGGGGGGGDCSVQRQDEVFLKMPVLYKVQWVLQNVSSSAAFIVTGLYWVVMYSPNKAESVRSINSHVLNSVLVLADLFLSRMPVRIHHFIHTCGYITLYIFFSLLYWAAGGTNHEGNPYIYTLMNYGEHPGQAVAVVLAVDFVGTPLMQIILYALFRLRQWACGRCRRRTEAAVPTAEVHVSNGSLASKNGLQKNGEKNISQEKVSDTMHDFRGRNYTLTSNKEEGDVMIDVDMDFEMDEVPATVIRPPLQTNNSQVSCTDSTQALLT